MGGKIRQHMSNLQLGPRSPPLLQSSRSRRFKAGIEVARKRRTHSLMQRSRVPPNSASLRVDLIYSSANTRPSYQAKTTRSGD